MADLDNIPEDLDLLAALKRANDIIGVMANYVGKMATPEEFFAELNEHWLYMQKLAREEKRNRRRK